MVLRIFQNLRRLMKNKLGRKVSPLSFKQKGMVYFLKLFLLFQVTKHRCIKKGIMYSGFFIFHSHAIYNYNT